MEARKLIDVIEWYRDEWHKSDFCHTKLIEKIIQANDEKELSIYEQAVDNWLDY